MYLIAAKIEEFGTLIFKVFLFYVKWWAIIILKIVKRNHNNINLKEKAPLSSFKGYFNPIQDIFVLEMNNSYISSALNIDGLNSTRKSITKE